MRTIQRRIAWSVLALAVLSWPVACILKMLQVHRIAKDTSSSLIQYNPDFGLPTGRVIECQWTLGYCRIVGFSCRDQQSFDILSRCGRIERLFVSDMSANASFCETLARIRVSSVTLLGLSVDINVAVALSQTNAKDVALRSCLLADGDGTFAMIEEMSVSQYVFTCRSSQPLKYVPIPRSTSKLLLVSTLLPENLDEFAASSGDLKVMELWIADFRNEKLDWICSSIPLKAVFLRGKNCNLTSMAACSEEKKVVHALR